MRKALLIGTNVEINNYINSVSYFLHTSRNYNHIMVLTSETIQKPTKSVIMALMKQLLMDTQSGDELWFHYIGKVDKINDVSIWPMDYDKNGFITDTELRQQLIDKVRVGVSLYVILDCIHTGSGFDLRYKYNDYSKYGLSSNVIKYNYNEWNLIQTMSENKNYSKTSANIYVLSCGSELGNNNIDLGGLTYSLLKVLKNNYGNIKWKYLLKDVNCLLKIKKCNQIAQLSTGKYLDTNTQVFQNVLFVFC